MRQFRTMFSSDAMMGAGVEIGTIAVSWMGPQMVLRQHDVGWKGVGLTALFGAAAAFLANNFLGRKAGEAAARGAVVGTLIKGVAVARKMPVPIYIFKPRGAMTSEGTAGVGDGYSMSPEEMIAAESMGQIPGSQIDGVGSFLDTSEPGVSGVGDFITTHDVGAYY